MTFGLTQMHATLLWTVQNEWRLAGLTYGTRRGDVHAGRAEAFASALEMLELATAADETGKSTALLAVATGPQALRGGRLRAPMPFQARPRHQEDTEP